MPLKFAIFGLRNLLIKADADSSKGTISPYWSSEFTHLIRFLRSKSIEPVMFSNTAWTVDATDIRQHCEQEWGKMRWFVASQSDIPFKPKKDALETVINKLGCSKNEAVFIGNSDVDFKAAVNANMLFLNGTWYGKKVDYGFCFDTPKEIAKFIDLFCVRQHEWHYAINVGSLDYYSLAPYSTRVSGSANYSYDAVATSKRGAGSPEFWGRYLCATLYLTGVYQNIQYYCQFPGHKSGVQRAPLRDIVDSFAKCFRAKFLPDLVIRHKTSPKSQYNRATCTHDRQLQSLQLNRNPTKNARGQKYKNTPLKRGKTVLIIDDICTEGYSLDSARYLIEQTDAKAVMVSWLKTINRGFHELVCPTKCDPYKTQRPNLSQLSETVHPYQGTITDACASSELASKFDEYESWDWPSTN